MNVEVSERSFEAAIECGLLQYGPDAWAGDSTSAREASPPYGESVPGGYLKRSPAEYDRSLRLIPRDVIDFVLATQPKEWTKLEQHHGASVKQQFQARLAGEIARRGALEVLRQGIKDSGCKFRLAYFRPASGLNDETKRLHAANLFSIVRQLRYSYKNENSIDLVLFLNGIPIFTAELKNPLTAQTVEDAIRGPEYRFLIVANKFQTGFDQPMLHSMYVDKKLGGVNAVQTLSRLNRTHPEKPGTLVLDFANEADEIQLAFEPYYETTLLSEATDPNLLYEIQSRMLSFPVFTEGEVDDFAKVYFDRKATQDGLYALLAPILTFADTDLEKLHVFAKHLRRLLPSDPAELPREVRQNIDMESYRIQQTGSGKIALARKNGALDPVGTKGAHGAAPDGMEVLSRIIADLNERFGLNLGPEHRLTLGQMMQKLDADAGLDASARVNTRENVRLTFDHKVEQVIQEIVDSNFDLYKRITDDRAFGEAIKNLLFDQYLREHRQAEELIKLGESKTLEFKSTLRWSIKEDRQDDTFVTHAALKTIAAFLNTEGGDLLIGVADEGSIVASSRIVSRTTTSSCATWRSRSRTASATGRAPASIPRRRWSTARRSAS